MNEDCTFCGSLVDRIVPGRIRDEKEVAELEEKHGYADPLLDVGEVFGVWVIEGDEKLNDVLPFKKAGLLDKVFVTPDMSPYKKRKVRILNGAHTGFVLGAYLAGENIVRDCMNDETIKGFMNKMLYDEAVSYTHLKGLKDPRSVKDQVLGNLMELSSIKSCQRVLSAVDGLGLKSLVNVA